MTKNKFANNIDPENESFQIDQWPFYGIVRLVSRYHLKLDALLKPIDMDVARWRVLMTLNSGRASTVTAIAAEAVMKISTMAKIIQRMAAQGLVETRTSKEDARLIEISITKEGRRVLPAIRAKVGRVSNEAFKGISEADLRELNRIIGDVYNNLSP